MILITGATGTNGREIVKQLSDKGVKIRVMIRKRERERRLSALVKHRVCHWKF